MSDLIRKQKMLCERLDALPSVEPERKKGEWVEDDHEKGFSECSKCGYIGKSPYDNPPIDYSEMKIREPYWIEQDNGGYIYGGWEIPEDNRTDDYGEYLLMQSGKKLRRFDASWQAYRKERE